MSKLSDVISKRWTNWVAQPWTCLGTRQYAHFLGAFALSWIGASGRRDVLAELDRRMSRKLKVRVGPYSFVVDCRRNDELCRGFGDNSYTFSTVREMYFRNTYLQPQHLRLEDIRNVVDLGGNRGLFTLLATSFCSRCLYVEASADFTSVARFNLALNGRDNFVIKNACVGQGGVLSDSPMSRESLDEIVRESGFEIVDLLKVDIEGSEFGLFEGAQSLPRIRYISMEVHPEHGSVVLLADQLAQRNFTVVLHDGNLRPTESVDQAVYLFARNRGLTDSRPADGKRASKYETPGVLMPL